MKNCKLSVSLKFFYFFISLFFLSCSNEKSPSLCDCLTKAEYSNGGTKQEKCKELFQSKYGTSEPSLDQMRDDYYNCK